MTAADQPAVKRCVLCGGQGHIWSGANRRICDCKKDQPMTSQSKNSSPERVIEMMEDLANRNNPRMALMTEPMQAQPFEEQRKHKLSWFVRQYFNAAPTANVFQSRVTILLDQFASQVIAADPATPALAEAVELLKRLYAGHAGARDAVRDFLARHGGK